MAQTCETCGQTLTRSDVASGRCPKCRSRVKQSAPQRTLAAGGIADADDGTLLPGSVVPESVGSDDISFTLAGVDSSDSDAVRHRATVDTSVSLANPAIRTVEATDAPPPPASPPKVASDGRVTWSSGRARNGHVGRVQSPTSSSTKRFRRDRRSTLLRSFRMGSLGKGARRQDWLGVCSPIRGIERKAVGLDRLALRRKDSRFAATFDAARRRAVAGRRVRDRRPTW